MRELELVYFLLCLEVGLDNVIMMLKCFTLSTTFVGQSLCCSGRASKLPALDFLITSKSNPPLDITIYIALFPPRILARILDGPILVIIIVPPSPPPPHPPLSLLKKQPQPQPNSPFPLPIQQMV